MKVLTYAADCNTVINKNMQLNVISYHTDIFTTPLEEYGYTNLVFKFGDIYYCEGHYKMDKLTDNPETVINHFNTYLANIPTRNWIQSIFITLFEKLGMDTTQLLEIRAKQIQEREDKRKAEIKAKADKVQIQLQKRLNELNVAKNNLIAGEKICKDDFIELVKIYSIPLHIRTIGMLNKLQKADIGINQAYVQGSNAKKVNLNKVFEAAKLLSTC